MTTTFTGTLLAAFALVPLALLTACGGSSSSKATASGLSKAATPKGAAALQALGDPKLTAADLEAMKTYGFKDCVTTADQKN
jgi:hypothetical protein